MADILTVTKAVIDLLSSNELSRMQCIFVLEAVKMTMHEEITKEIVEDVTRGRHSDAGIA